MTEKRQGSTPTDATLEREIEGLLAVDPSPEFLARVRTRLAEEPAPSRWHFRWLLLLVPAAAAILAMIVLLPAQMGRPGAPVQGIARAPVPRPETEARAVPTPATRPAAPSRTAHGVQTAAIPRDRVPDHHVDVSSPPQAPSPLAPMPSLERIAFSPITIRPLAFAALGEGVRQ
jgi:hypothetical protein